MARVAGTPDMTDTLLFTMSMELGMPQDGNIPERWHGEEIQHGEGMGRRRSLKCGGENKVTHFPS